MPPPVVTEAYYRIRWGSEAEFLALFEKNHLPILKAAKARGIVLAIKTDVPFTHMAGNQRWDMRVAITYRDAPGALLTAPEWTRVFDEELARLKKANPRFDEEEARRFSLLEEHWDVILYPEAQD